MVSLRMIDRQNYIVRGIAEEAGRLEEIHNATKHARCALLTQSARWLIDHNEMDWTGFARNDQNLDDALLRFHRAIRLVRLSTILLFHLLSP